MNGRKVLGILFLSGALVALVTLLVQATAPVSGPSIHFGSSNSVADLAVDVNAVAAGDLDNDGWIDLATASASTTNELLAWENDTSPFSGVWSSGSGGIVGDAADQVNGIALGDLDHDGYLDLVSGDNNDDVSIWRNDHTPFNGAWGANYNIGDGVGDVYDVAVADFDGDGNLDIATVSLSDGSTGYELVVWENPYSAGDTNPFDQVWTAHNVTDTVSLHAVAVADLNRDGRADLVTGDADNRVRIWGNDGSWAFTLRTTLTGDGDIAALAVADFDQNGYVDIVSGGVVETGGTYEVIVWENDADTTFDWSFTEHDAADTGDVVNGLVAADFNLDGYADFAAVADTGESSEVITWENDGDSPFDWSFTRVDVGAQSTDVLAVTAADVDNDGDADLVIGRGVDAGTGEIAVWEDEIVHRNASFDAGGNDVGASTDHVYAVALGDLDGDGDLDAVSGSRSGEDYELVAWQNDGTPFDGGWSSNDSAAVTNTVDSVALGDLDNDGDLDAVVGSEQGAGSEVVVLENDGTPFIGVWASNNLTHTNTMHSVTVGDLDNDGDLDIVSGGKTSGREIVAWQNDGTPFTGSWPGNSVGGSATNTVHDVKVVDMDNDGDLDIVAADTHGFDTIIAAWRNDGTPFSGNWMSGTITMTASIVNRIAVGDLDNDGDADVVSGGMLGTNPGLFAFENDGTPFDGIWTSINRISSDVVNAVELGDLDHDGDLDLIVGSGINVIVWENDGSPFDGSWTQNSTNGTGATVKGVAVGDLDGDGDLDVFSGSQLHAGYEVMAWPNIGGSADLEVADFSPGTYIPDSSEHEVLKVVFTHNGVSGDADLELNRFDLKLTRSDCTTALTSNEVNAFIDNLRVRVDDGDNSFNEITDTLVVDADTLALTAGVQVVTFTEEITVQVSPGSSKTYWVSVRTTSDASSQNPNNFCMIFDPDADALVDAKSPDSTVSIRDTEPISTGDVPTVVTVRSFQAQAVATRGIYVWIALTGLLAGLMLVLRGVKRRVRV